MQQDNNAADLDKQLHEKLKPFAKVYQDLKDSLIVRLLATRSFLYPSDLDTGKAKDAAENKITALTYSLLTKAHFLTYDPAAVYAHMMLATLLVGIFMAANMIFGMPLWLAGGIMAVPLGVCLFMITGDMVTDRAINQHIVLIHDNTVAKAPANEREVLASALALSILVSAWAIRTGTPMPTPGGD